MEIIHDKETCTFYLIKDNVKAYVQYELNNDVFDIISTQVPKELSGQGIAKMLVKNAYDYAKSEGYKLKGTCSFADAFLKRNHSYLN